MGKAVRYGREFIVAEHLTTCILHFLILLGWQCSRMASISVLANNKPDAILSTSVRLKHLQNTTEH